MKALVLTAYRQFSYMDVPEPEVAEHSVRVRVHSCGICGSDIHGMTGATGRRIPPIIMGHEASGTIELVGAQVTGWRVGDRVTFDSTVYCGECWYCRRGQINLCDKRRVLGVSCEEYREHGAFAEYVSVPARVLYRLPDNVTFEQGAFVEPISIAVHAVARAQIHLGDTAVVVGAGMIGLLLIQVLRQTGCGRIIAVDVDRHRLKLAQALGAAVGLRPDTGDLAAEIRALTGNRGADLVFEVVGASETVDTAVACVRKGGQVILIGNVSPSVALPLQSVVTREITLLGSCASQGEYETCLALLASGAVKVEPLISAAAPLAEGAHWFKRLSQRHHGLFKVLLQPATE